MGIEEQQVDQSTEANTASTEAEVNWGDLAADVDDAGEAFVVEAEGNEPAVEGEAPTDPPPAESVQSPTDASATVAKGGQPATPSASQVSPQSPAPSQQQQTPQGEQQQPPVEQSAAPAKTPEQLREEYHSKLVEHYAINDEDAIALATTPEQVLPRLAANMHVRVMEEVTQHINAAMQMVPQMLEMRMKQAEAEEKAKQDFFGVWPGLTEHYDTIVQNARMARNANPSATRQQVIEMAGMMTALALGLDPAAVRAAQQVQAQPQRQQVQQAPRPMRPAAPGPAPQGMPQSSGNIFADFADDDLDFLQG